MKLNDIVFSKWSKILHTIWFVVWFLCHLDINLLTLIVSLEAIYLELFLGDNQSDAAESDEHHKKLLTEIHEHITRKNQ